jgi:hypothetical protein
MAASRRAQEGVAHDLSSDALAFERLSSYMLLGNKVKILFDTNVFRDIQRGNISEGQVDSALEKLASQGDGYFSALSLFELGSHLDDQERENYERFRDAFRAAERLCARALPDPESFMGRHAFHIEPSWESINEEEVLLLARLINAADTYDELAVSREVKLHGQMVRATFNRGFLRAFRAKVEGDYVADMYDNVANRVIPDYDLKRKQGTGPVRLNEGPERTKFLQFLQGSEMREELVRSQATRLALDWDMIPATVEDVSNRLDAFFSAFLTILTEFLRDGYNPEKNKNDFNDIHFLSYLCDPEVVFVTQDGRARKKVSDSSPQSKRIFSFKEWLSSS